MEEQVVTPPSEVEPLKTVGERLTAALSRLGKTARWLHLELDDGGVKGSSYGSVWAYVRNRREPKAVWITATAGVLGVRVEWLAYGRGPMTGPEDEKSEEARRHRIWEKLVQSDPGLELRPAFRQMIAEAIMRREHLRALPDYVISALIEPLYHSIGVPERVRPLAKMWQTEGLAALNDNLKESEYWERFIDEVGELVDERLGRLAPLRQVDGREHLAAVLIEAGVLHLQHAARPQPDAVS